ncbi:MAG: [LysW]-lysine hydrolase [Anaerolineae bacterium]
MPHTDLLLELVKRYSPSTLEAPAVQYLVQWMSERGFEAYIDEAGNAFGIRGASNATNTLILLGHIDTFPGDIPVRVERVDDHPLEDKSFAELSEGYTLYGRGSVDAKGSLCAFAEATAQATIPEGWRVIVAGCVEEEIATGKGSNYVSDHFTPTACVIGEPSSSNRITLGYKGRLLVEYLLRRAVAHTARPEPTVAALGSEFWQRILEWAERENRGVERIFDQLLPGLRSINTSSDYFNETVTLNVSFRLPPRISPDDIMRALKAIAQPDGELRAWGHEQAYESDRNNALVRGLMGAIRGQGGQPGFVLKTGTSDMNTVGAKWTCPIVAYGPGDSNLDHTPHENLPLDEYDKAIDTLKHLIEHLAD